MPLVGAEVLVQVLTPAQKELERKAKELLLDRRIIGVFLVQEQLLLRLDDGGQFAINCPGGFKEVD
jgi:hypothetical protein